MPGSARLCLISGLLVLGLAVFNALTAGAFTPALQRAEVLSGMAAVGLSAGPGTPVATSAE